MSIHGEGDFQRNPWNDIQTSLRVPPPQATGVLPQASGVDIVSSTLTSAGGNIITINNGPRAESPQLLAPPVAAPTIRSQRSFSSGMLRSSDGESSLHDSEIYAKYLLPKKHGYPLWIPQPPSDLPPEYRYHGVSIGDVGVVTPDGVFDFLFNIFLPADHPINRRLVPEDFVPLNGSVRDVRFNETTWGKHSCVSSNSIESSRLYSQSTLSTYVFTCNSSNGAILTLPDGALRQDLRNVHAVSAYAFKHAISWYKYMNQVRGWDTPNGTLYVITGCDKSTLWGNASFSHSSNTRAFDLRYTRALTQTSSAYVWEQSTGVLASTNSSSRAADVVHNVQNQCVFLRGFQIRIRESIWAMLRSPVMVKDLSATTPKSLMSKSTYVPFGAKKSTKKLKPDPKTGQKPNKKKNKKANKERRKAKDDWDVTLVHNPPRNSEIVHPSDTINRYLLERTANADVALTHDDVWMSLLTDSEASVPDNSELLKRLEDNYQPIVKSGFVYLHAKGETAADSDTPRGRILNQGSVPWKLRTALEGRLENSHLKAEDIENTLVETPMDPDCGDWFSPLAKDKGASTRYKLSRETSISSSVASTKSVLSMVWDVVASLKRLGAGRTSVAGP